MLSSFAIVLLVYVDGCGEERFSGAELSLADSWFLVADPLLGAGLFS